MSSLGFTATPELSEQEVPENGARVGVFVDSNEDSLEYPHGPVKLVAELVSVKDDLQLERARNAQLETENAQLRQRGYTDRLYRDQLHFLAISSSRQESDDLQRTNAHLLRQHENDRARIESLEQQLHEQNIALRKADTRTLNYDALCDRAGRLEVENRAVVEQRDGINRELREVREQGARMARQKDELTERLRELGRNVVDLKTEFEEKLRVQEATIKFWQHKYQCELEECRHRNYNSRRCNDHAVSETSVIPNDININSLAQSNSDDSLESVGASSDQRNSVSPPPSVTHIYPPSNDEHLATPLGGNEPIVKKLDDAITVDDEVRSEPRTKKMRFEVGRSELPQCKNCCTIFDMMRSASSPCSFHRLPPQPYRQGRWNQDEETTVLAPPDRKPKFYWPCCNKVGVKEPPGCQPLRKHEIVFPPEPEE